MAGSSRPDISRIPFFNGFSVTFFTNYINLVLIAVVLISGGMLLWPSLRQGGRGGVSAGEATQLINRRNAAVIDLRSAEDFANGHLPSARNLQFSELAAKIAQSVKNKSNPVLLVCQTGQQSHKALRIVKDAGFAEVHVLDGGVNGWEKAGMPVVKQGGSK
jgi:rhodanese-related sulfurtransferase